MDGKRLLQVSFSNSARLSGNTHYFRYLGHDFKLVQSRSKYHADTLLSIIKDDKASERAAFVAAAQFFSALCWKTQGRVEFNLGPSSTSRVPRSLQDARVTMIDFQKIAPGSETAGNFISVLPDIQTPAQREALALYREANASNNIYLRFLFFFQVLTIGASKAPLNTKDQIANVLAHPRWQLRDPHKVIDRLPLKGQTLAEYLYDDCRNAIGHVKRGGKKEIDFDDPEHRFRIAESTTVAKQLAAAHIEWNLGLTGELYLKQLPTSPIPEFLPSGTQPGKWVGLPKFKPPPKPVGRPRRVA